MTGNCRLWWSTQIPVNDLKAEFQKNTCNPASKKRAKQVNPVNLILKSRHLLKLFLDLAMNFNRKVNIFLLILSLSFFLSLYIE
jgi:hypothetical protein